MQFYPNRVLNLVCVAIQVSTTAVVPYVLLLSMLLSTISTVSIPSAAGLGELESAFGPKAFRAAYAEACAPDPGFETDPEVV
jgi:hypothetical protein